MQYPGIYRRKTRQQKRSAKLHDGWQTYRINHSEAYAIDHVSTNQAESFFSRLRRMVRGQHHHVSARHLHQYANHAAWLKDHRRECNCELAGRALGWRWRIS
jgi:hypothetical protein